MPASYFDVDGTLVRTNLVHPTVYYLINQPSPFQSLRKLGETLLNAPRLAAAEVLDRRMFNELLFAAYKGVSEDRLMVLVEEVLDNVLKPALFKGSRELVRKCRDAGHDVVLVSGALDIHMRPLAKELGATDVIANRLEIKDGYATGKLMRPVVAGPEKAVLVREHARRHGHDLTDCFAYSDSHSDVSMLSVVGHPAAVNPDRGLERMARVYSWPVIHLERRA
jgi:HAD superfamily hydrolase (TIGR01490 family)